MSSARETPVRHFLPAMTVAGAGVLLSVAAYLYVDRLERARLAAEFESAAAQPIFAIQRQIQADLGAVQSLVAFYNGSRYVERAEFRTFAAPILAWHPSIRALEWLPRVPAAERRQHEAEARRDGHQQYRITERSRRGNLVAARSRAEHFPVHYVEPLAGNEAALGFDLASDAVRRAALDAARDVGVMQATGPLTLVQETTGQLGFLVVAPVYQGGFGDASLTEPTKPLRGFVLAVFRMGGLVTAALSGGGLIPSPPPPAFDLHVYDLDGADVQSLHAQTALGGPPRDRLELLAGRHAQSTIEVAGRTWQIVIAPASALTRAGQAWLPWAVLLAGLGATGCAVPVYHLRRRGQERLAQLARSLDEKNKTLERLSSDLARYLPAQVYRSIFTGARAASIATERKKLTVVFSDIEDFTEVTADLEPEDLAFLINDYFTEMSAIAVRHGATIDKFIGDAMLMFFGDPESRGVREDALAAVTMAVAMQRRMADLRARWHDLGHRRSFHMRIGINSGYCNVGNFGSRERMAYTIIGGEVNTAARMERIAEPDGITLTGETYALVKDHFEARAGEPIAVKGLPREIRPYFVVGIHDGDDVGREVIRAESKALRVFVDLTQVDLAEREEIAGQMEAIAQRLRAS